MLEQEGHHADDAPPLARQEGSTTDDLAAAPDASEAAVPVRDPVPPSTPSLPGGGEVQWRDERMRRTWGGMRRA